MIGGEAYRKSEKSAGTVCGQLTRRGNIEEFGGYPLRAGVAP